LPIYNRFMVITELDKEWLRAQTKKLSALQRKLLAKGLFTYHHHRPLAIACGLPNPGRFDLKHSMEEHTPGRVRASKRAAAGRAIQRLMARGLLECCTHGQWRLTPNGVEVALRLNPHASPPSEEELAHRIALRKAFSAWEDSHPALAGKRRRRAKSESGSDT
jgi:hypothetical protein